MHRIPLFATGAALILLAACAPSNNTSDTASANKGGATSTPAATGQVHVIEMTTDATGSYFKPKQIEVKRGDVLRYTLVAGVHNVDFFPDSNPTWKGAPIVSDMLQLPGQTFDVPVNFAAGTYYFHCDPHAALGMVGRVTVSQ